MDEDSLPPPAYVKATGFTSCLILGRLQTGIVRAKARISEFGETSLVHIASDATRLQMRRIVDRLIAEERVALAPELPNQHWRDALAGN
jgi:hypothetical protein